MNLNDLENIIQRKYDAQQDELNLDALWANVAPEIPKEKSNHKFIFWFIGISAIVAILGLSGLYFFNDNSRASLTIGESSIVKSNINSEPVTKKDLTRNELNQNASEENVDLKNVQQDFNALSQQQTLATQEDVQRLKETISSMQQVIKSQNAAVKQLVSTLNAQSNNQHWDVTRSTQSNLTIVENNDSKIEENDKLVRTTLRNFNSLSRQMPTLDFKASKAPIDFTYVPMSESEVLKEKEEKKLFRSFEALVGYGIAMKSLNSKTSSAQNVLTTRKGNESTLEVLSFDLNYSRQISNQLIFGIGLNYDLQTERTIHQFEANENVLLDETLLETITEENGNTQEITGSARANTTVFTTKTRYNYYQKISLPIRLSFFKEFGKWQGDFGVGTRVCLYSNQTGFIQENTNTEYNIESDKQDYFDALWSTELLGFVGLNYQANDKISWRSTFNYQFGVKGWETANNPIKQRYHLLNFKSGINYRF